MLKMNIKTPQTLKLNYSGGSSIIVDDVPIENSKNAVSSGGVYTSLKELEDKIENVEIDVDLSNYYTKDEIDETLDNKVEISIDNKMGDIDLILDEIINGSLEVDNKEY